MHNVRLVAALAFAAALVVTPDAFAGKPPKGGDTTTTAAASAEVDPYAYPEMLATNVPDFDTFFSNANAPIKSTIDARKRVDMAQNDLADALGLAKGSPMKDAAAELQKKAERKVKVAMTGKMPRLEATEAVPDDVQKGIDAFNAALTDMEGAFGELEGLQPQLAELATQAAGMVATAPDTIKSAGVPMPKIPASLSATKQNAKTIDTSKAEVGSLLDSLKAISADVQASFAAE